MKGQAFVTLPNENGARHAVKDANGFVLKGKPMAVVSFQFFRFCFFNHHCLKLFYIHDLYN